MKEYRIPYYEGFILVGLKAYQTKSLRWVECQGPSEWALVIAHAGRVNLVAVTIRDESSGEEDYMILTPEMLASA